MSASGPPSSSSPDVWFGKGGIRHKPGNQVCREFCRSKLHRYLEHPTTAIKNELAMEIVGFVYERGGNFLKKVNGKLSVVLGDEALSKAAQLVLDEKKKTDRVLKKAQARGIVVTDNNVLQVAAWLNPDIIQPSLLPVASIKTVKVLCSVGIMQKCNKGDCQDAAAPSCFAICRNIQAAVRRHCKSPSAAIEAIHSSGMESFSQDDKETWDAALAMLPHVESLRCYYVGNRTFHHHHEDDQLAMTDLFTQSGHVALYASRNFDVAMTNYNAAFDILSQVYGTRGDPNHVRAAMALAYIGNVHQAKNQHELARDMYNQALAMMRDNNNNNSNEKASNLLIAQMLHNVGRMDFCLMAGGPMTESERPLACFHEAAQMKQHLGASPKSIAVTLANTARIHQGAGRFQQALDVYQEIRRIHGVGYRSLFGATTCLNEGQVYQDLGDFDTARNKYEEALEIYDQVYGHMARNDSVAMAHCYLGSALVDMEDLDHAETHLIQAYDMMILVVGNDTIHESIANIIFQIGRLQEKRGDKEDAKASYLEAKRILDALVQG